MNNRMKFKILTKVMKCYHGEGKYHIIPIGTKVVTIKGDRPHDHSNTMCILRGISFLKAKLKDSGRVAEFNFVEYPLTREEIEIQSIAMENLKILENMI